MDEGATTTVLVVDDEEAVTEAYSMWLDAEYETRVATGGREAIEELDAAVDVVLLDRRMPRVSGDDVLAEIRDRGLDCRVAMVTAVDPDFDVVDLAFDDYVTKPAGPDEIRETVERLQRLADYDAAVRERFALASTKAALEAEMTRAELADSEEYQRVVADLEAVEDRVSDLPAVDADLLGATIGGPPGERPD